MPPELNMEIIKRAMRTTSFDLLPSDFTTSKYQNEIRYLFTLNYFPKFDMKKTVDRVDRTRLNAAIRALKQENMQKFKSMHKYNLKGIGPGEVTLFFLIDNCTLGGGSSTALDVFVRNKAYEVKSVQISNGMAYDFRLGGNVPLTGIISTLNDIRVKHNLGGSSTEISGAIINAMKQKAPTDFMNVEIEYSKLAEKYFRGHEVIFINNSPTMKMGDIEAIKKVTASDITIDRVTSGTVKPKVKL